jgi:HD-like signal output (HDOD) protein
MRIAQQAKEQILKLQHLPPLSATATRLLGLLSQEDLALNQLAEVINQDPGLTARLLGLANSAYFGQQNPVLNVEDAIIRVLGLNMVKSLAFSIALSGSFDISDCRQFDLKRYWRDALTLAMLARLLCVKGDTGDSLDPDAVYLAGLLKNIGVLVLVHLFPAQYSQVIQKQLQLGGNGDVLELEKEQIGLNHREAGAWLANRWHLPELIVSVIAQAGVSAQEQENEVALVGAISCWLFEADLDEALAMRCKSALYEYCGLSPDRLETIKQGFMEDEDEIKVIANLLAS